MLGRAADQQLNQRLPFSFNFNKQGYSKEDESLDDDIDEEALKEALEKAKAAAEKLSERPRSNKK